MPVAANSGAEWVAQLLGTRPGAPNAHGDFVAALGRVFDAIDADPAAPMPIDRMAAIARYSRFHFERQFHRYTTAFRPPHIAAYGMTPRAYVTATRLTHAKRLLTTTDLSITDITLAVGYTSLGTFSNRFRADVGVSPMEYRHGPNLVARIHVRISADGTGMDAYDRNPDRNPGLPVLASAKVVDEHGGWAIVGVPTEQPYTSIPAAQAALRQHGRDLLTYETPTAPSAPTAPTGPALTSRQWAILRTIHDLTLTTGYPPSYPEIGAAVGLTSSSVAAHIGVLERHELLRRGPFRQRTLRLTDEGRRWL